ncbi:MAG: hypothetical protein QXN21_00780 [Candidatus Bathyarchaeia archaeon]
MKMARRSRKDTQQMRNAIVVLLRNTTWKCGKIERLIIEYLQNRLRKYGTAHSSVNEIAQYFNFNGKQKSELFDALKRLEKRYIVEIKAL